MLEAIKKDKLDELLIDSNNELSNSMLFYSILKLKYTDRENIKRCSEEVKEIYPKVRKLLEKFIIFPNEDLTMKPFKQTEVVFDLVRKIRNRAFHLENMYKIRSGYGRYKFHIQMQDIESFLDTVMKSFDRDFYEKELKKHFP